MDKTESEILSNFGGEVNNCLDTIFSNIDDDAEASPFIQTSTFLDANDTDIESFFGKHANHFTLFSMNADSLHAKHAHLRIFVDRLLTKGMFFSAICIQEARIHKNTNCKMLDLPKYNLIPKPSVCSKKGGLAIYLHQDFFSFDRTDTLYKKSKIWEGQFVDVYGPSIKKQSYQCKIVSQLC